MSSKTYFITGATGTQGNATVEALLRSSNKPTIKALTRNTESAKAKALSQKGVQLVKGSFHDKQILVEALKGAGGAFLMGDNMKGAEEEIKQGKSFIDAAVEAKLPFLVYTSVEGADRDTGVPHFDSKYQVEKYLAASGIPHAVLRPVAFYDNFPKQKGVGSAIALGMFDAALYGKRLQIVAAKDIGFFAAQALENPEEWKGKKFALAGDDLNVQEMSAAYAKVFGAAAWVVPVPGFFIRLLPYDFRTMFYWFKSHGYTADIQQCREKNPNMLTLQEWLKEQNPQLS